MEIKVIASGSTGNCYKIGDGITDLLIECGIPINRLKIALDFNLNGVVGCLVTHEHNDHSKAIMDVARAGIDIYTSKGTINSLKLEESHRIHTVKALQQFEIGTWSILAFDTQHDATEPLGYLLYSNITHEKLLFATDTYYVRYKFLGLTHIMIECNYDVNILEENIASGLVSPAIKKRLIKSHFEITNLINFLQSNDLSKVINIHIIHLSTNNGNSNEFGKRIMAKTGIPVFTAQKNGGVI